MRLIASERNAIVFRKGNSLWVVDSGSRAKVLQQIDIAQDGLAIVQDTKEVRVLKVSAAGTAFVKKHTGQAAKDAATWF